MHNDDQQSPDPSKSSSTSPPHNAAWLAKRLGVTVNPDGWTSAQCPTHHDDQPSLSFKDSDDGLALFVSCKRGSPCSIEEIALSQGLTDDDLIFLRGGKGWESQSVTYWYNNPDGTHAYQIVRQPRPDGKKTFKIRRRDGDRWVWKRPETTIPFRLDALRDITDQDVCYVVEGEKDALNLVAAGETYATTNPFGAGKWRSEHTEALVAAGVKHAIILYDYDESGIDHARAVKASLVAAGIEAHILTLPGQEAMDAGADVSDWLAAGHTIEEIREGHVLEDVVVDEHAEGAEDHGVEVVEPYHFEPAFPADHFVSQVIAHLARCTDAAREYAEAGALALLATATNRVIAHVAAYPRGLHTNLYVLALGSSTRSRKSTSLDITKTIHEACEPIKLGVLPDSMTPEALMEQMAQRDGHATAWYHDEFGAWMSKLHHAHFMEGLKGWLLSFYDCKPTTYTRHSKRIKGGHKEDDFDAVERPHLTIFGVTTPLLFSKLSMDDIESGLLPRFAIIYPQGHRPRRSLFVREEGLVEERAEIVKRLEEIAEWNKHGIIVTITEGARARLDAFDERNENRDETVGSLMYRRLPPMLAKVAILAAVGRAGERTYLKLEVTEEDVVRAERVLDRWIRSTEIFIKNLSASEFDRKRIQCLNHLRRATGGTLLRRDISRHANVPKKFLDDIEATLLDRGEITVFEADKGRTWKVKETTR